MRKETILFVCFLAAVFLLLLSRIDGSAPSPDDASVYVSLGTNMVTGHGYRVALGPHVAPHSYYPFLFPLMLGGIIYLFGNNFYVMHLMQACFLFLSLMAAYFLIKPKTTLLSTYMVVWCSAASVFMLQIMSHLYSEMAYLFFSILSLWCVEKYFAAKGIFSKVFFFCAVFLTAAFFTRVMGLSLIVAALLFLFFERPSREDRVSLRKPFMLAFVTLLPVFFWFLRSYMVQGTLRGGILRIMSTLWQVSEISIRIRACRIGRSS
jgi:hypothetical protein